MLGFDVIAAETEEGWAQFFKSLKERGLSGRAAGDFRCAQGTEEPRCARF